MSIHPFTARTIKGGEMPLEAFEGKVLLIVNTASKCGLTPQYEGLQKLYDTYKHRGLEILGFPCNQFAEQEPGSNEEVERFCSVHYGVTFPMFGKVDVKGEHAHPLFVYLTGGDGEKIPWNFTKFLIDRQGNPVQRFDPKTEPEDLKQDIEALL
ncbi:MAG TPA: glutathione peroxidase [Paenibacillus sp.]|uniref:glutathione peroxidase n=1 Tax=Paenibacillus sp. TaxID=58172 RepID=UPI0028D90CB2|nr:glutathione peroxidase [Paenibacillus sp.]HUC93650.1 glutathione peroxidase [Paenibacillus sp.]